MSPWVGSGLTGSWSHDGSWSLKSLQDCFNFPLELNSQFVLECQNHISTQGYIDLFRRIDYWESLKKTFNVHKLKQKRFGTLNLVQNLQHITDFIICCLCTAEDSQFNWYFYNLNSLGGNDNGRSNERNSCLEASQTLMFYFSKEIRIWNRISNPNTVLLQMGVNARELP